MNIGWENKKLIYWQAEGLLLTRRNGTLRRSGCAFL